MPAGGDPPSGGKRQFGGELIIPLAALGFTLYYFSTILNSPWTAQVNAFMVGSVLIVLVLAFVGVTVREVIAGRGDLGISLLFGPRKVLARRGAFILLTLLYLLAIPWLGFTLTTFLFLAGSMLVLGGRQRPLKPIIIAAVMAAIGYAVFIPLFETRLPRGPVEALLAGWR